MVHSLAMNPEHASRIMTDMSRCALALSSLVLLVASSRAGHADPLQLGLGLEGGNRIETDWFGGVAELDLRLTRYLSLAAVGRAQHFAQTTDTCDFQSTGTQLDVTGGLRLDLIPVDRAADARPYVAAGIGGAWANVLGACKGTQAAWMSSLLLQGTVGVEFRSELPPGYSFRLEARASFADFAPGSELEAQFNPTWEHDQFDVEYSLAALLVIRL
jgi:hypothetical protein